MEYPKKTMIHHVSTWSSHKFGKQMNEAISELESKDFKIFDIKYSSYFCDTSEVDCFDAMIIYFDPTDES